ncbi:MAG TPA: S8 family serine peptidase [Candidatus Angelobacter sp.]|jgi:serine protease AprX|nr:S8 family serine peptidase [Candidatus Angelobacter sp.]
MKTRGTVKRGEGKAQKKMVTKAKVVASNATIKLGYAVREWPKLEIFSKREIARCRATVANEYGKAFASKASDRLCQALATVRSFQTEAAAPQPRPTILEFSEPQIKSAEFNKRIAVLAGEAEAAPLALHRIARIHLQRDSFAKQIAGVATQLERRAQMLFPAGLEAIASPTTPSSVVEICWLNSTMRTYLDPRSLREAASEATLQQLDLPRPLKADIDGTAPLVGAPQFRKRFSITGAHITVAVIDTEVDINHPALKGRVVQRTNSTKEHWGSPAGHGTAVAGIIASVDKKFTGMGPGLTITNYKVLATNPGLNSDDFGGSLAIQQALEDGAQVANCSWGAGPAGNGTGREAVACNNAWNLGLVIVKSAGNGGPGPSTLTTPADADGIIVVGATDRAGIAVQDYSSRGPANAKSRPHLVAPGGSEFDQIHSCLVGSGFGNAEFGTSFAAPHVSGLAALLLAHSPGMAPDQVRQKLLAQCHRLADGDENTQGKGFVSLESIS